MLGIDRNDTSLLLIGAISSALLAILLSALVRWFQTAKPRHALIVFVGILALLGGGGLIVSMPIELKQLRLQVNLVPNQKS